MPANPSVAAMHEHVTALIDKHQIVHYQTRSTTRAWSLREAEEIHTPPVKTWKSYITALHEIGHLLGRHQLSPHVMVRERWAWRWARQHALVWAPWMERYAEESLAWYAARARSIDAKWRPPFFERETGEVVRTLTAEEEG
jgi:hypothetical protein